MALGTEIYLLKSTSTQRIEYHLNYLEGGTYFLPFIGSNDMNNTQVILKEVDCDKEWNEDVIFHEVIDIF